jgi:hypothetical protein
MAKHEHSSAPQGKNQPQSALTPAQHALSMQLSNATTALVFLERAEGALHTWSRLAKTEWADMPKFAQESAPGYKANALQLMIVAIESDLKTARDIWWEHGHSFNCEAPISLGIAQSFVSALSGLLWIDVGSFSDHEMEAMDFRAMALTADMAHESLIEAVGELEAAIRALRDQEVQMDVGGQNPAGPVTVINSAPPKTPKRPSQTLEPLAA